MFERLYDKSYGHARTAVLMGLGVELFRVGQALSLENVLNNQLIRLVNIVVIIWWLLWRDGYLKFYAVILLVCKCVILFFKSGWICVH